MGRRFGAVVVYPDETIKDYGNILAIARAEAQTREGRKRNVEIKDIIFSPLCNVWIALYPSYNSNEKLLHKPSVTRRGRKM